MDGHVTDIVVQDEAPADHGAIHELTKIAFADKSFSAKDEHFLVDALREAGALAVSLVAVAEGSVVGHVAFSLAEMSTPDGAMADGWYALGPISVAPNFQGQGIGSRLARAGLERIKALGAKGCVLAGDPNYYTRFGFRHDPLITLENVPAGVSLVLRITDNDDHGFVRFHPAFSAPPPGKVAG